MYAIKVERFWRKKTNNENRVENPYMEIDFYAVRHRNTRFYFMFF